MASTQLLNLLMMGARNLAESSTKKPKDEPPKEEKKEEKKPEEEKPKADAKGMKKGGYVRAADGIAKRGKTKGRMV